MATKAWRAEEFRKPATFADLMFLMNCSTRISLLIALSAGPTQVSQLSRGLNYSLPLVSNHLRILRRLGIVDYESEADRHLYHLQTAAAIKLTDVSLELRLKADDGGVLVAHLPRNAPIMRVLEAAIAMVKRRAKKAQNDPIALKEPKVAKPGKGARAKPDLT